MNLITLFRHFRLRKWLPMYADGMLDKDLQEQVEAHLSQCPECSDRFIELENIRKAMVVENAKKVPDSESAPAWTNLQGALRTSQQQRSYNSRFMQTGWALAATMLLTASVLFLGRDTTNRTELQSVQASAVFDLNGLVQTFHEEKGREEFYTRQGAIPVNQGQCCIVNYYDAAMIAALQEHCNILKNRLLKSSDGKSIILECVIEGNIITIVQQDINAISPISSISSEIKVVTGIEYERLVQNDVKITRWKSGEGKVTVLGDIPDTDLEILIGASI